MELSLIVRGQHRQGDDMRARLADDIDLVMRAEELGFNALVKGSHYSAHPLQSLQQIPFLAQAAVLAPSLRLVCGLVLLPLHKPLDIAEQLATLDIMCGGKLVFGCGIGYRAWCTQRSQCQRQADRANGKYMSHVHVHSPKPDRGASRP